MEKMSQFRLSEARNLLSCPVLLVTETCRRHPKNYDLVRQPEEYERRSQISSVVYAGGGDMGPTPPIDEAQGSCSRGPSGLFLIIAFTGAE